MASERVDDPRRRFGPYASPGDRRKSDTMNTTRRIATGQQSLEKGVRSIVNQGAPAAFSNAPRRVVKQLNANAQAARMATPDRNYSAQLQQAKLRSKNPSVPIKRRGQTSSG